MISLLFDLNASNERIKPNNVPNNDAKSKNTVHPLNSISFYSYNEHLILRFSLPTLNLIDPIYNPIYCACR